MRNPVTSSERRGMIAVAAISLLVTGCGLLTGHCNRRQVEIPPPEVEVLVRGDSIPEASDSVRKRRGKRKKGRTDSVRATRKKVYRTRSRLDEPV